MTPVAQDAQMKVPVAREMQLRLMNWPMPRRVPILRERRPRCKRHSEANSRLLQRNVLSKEAKEAIREAPLSTPPGLPPITLSTAHRRRPQSAIQ